MPVPAAIAFLPLYAKALRRDIMRLRTQIFRIG